MIGRLECGERQECTTPRGGAASQFGDACPSYAVDLFTLREARPLLTINSPHSSGVLLAVVAVLLLPTAALAQATPPKAAEVQLTPAEIKEKELRKAKDIALEEMREQAKNLGANAIVGIDIDYETIGTNSSMLMVSASGTAVVLE